MITLAELEQQARNGCTLSQLSLGIHCHQTNDLKRATKFLNWAKIQGSEEAIALLEKIRIEAIRSKLGKVNI